jgi:hypothetical protein
MNNKVERGWMNSRQPTGLGDGVVPPGLETRSTSIIRSNLFITCRIGRFLLFPGSKFMSILDIVVGMIT